MRGARSGLVDTFAGRSSAEGKPRGLRYGWVEGENVHSIERFVCQGSHGADLGLYEIERKTTWEGRK